MPVILSKQRIISTTPTPRQTWTRPTEWLDMPDLSQGDEKVHMLVKVYEKGSNFIIFKFRGDYQVDWGDGTTVTTHADNTDAEHDYDWANAPSSSLTSGGYRQVILTVTAQGGSTLTQFIRPSSPYAHSNDVYRGFGNGNVLSVKIAGTAFTHMNLGMWTWIALEEFEYVGTAPNLSNVSNCFTSCNNLKKINQWNTSAVTNFANVFQNCYSLLEVPPLDTSSATNVTYMYYNCFSIDYIPPMDVSSSTNLTYTFNTCRSLNNNPISNYSGITNMTATYSNTRLKTFDASLPNVTGMHLCFDGCSDLEVVNITAGTGVLTTMSYTFRNCVNIKEIKPFDTSGVTSFLWCFSAIKTQCDFTWVDTSSTQNFESMFEGSYLTDASFLNVTSNATNLTEVFQNCTKLKKTPASFDCTNVTTIKGLFAYCYLLEDFPTLNNTGNITDTYNTFAYCKGLEVAPPIAGTLTSCRAMFSGAVNVATIPAYDLSGVTTYPNGYQFALSANNIRESLVTGITSRHSYQNCSMAQAELVTVFNNLGTANGSQTIYVDKNPGSADLTASDLLIATNKGWTVVS